MEDVAAVKSRLAELRPQHGGVGHNNPPPDDDEGSEASLAIGIVEDTIDRIAAELSKDTPDAVQVAQAGKIIRNAAHWLGGKLDLFAEEFAKSLGKSLGENVGKAIAAAGLIASLGVFLTHLASWLQAISWPF